MAVLGRLLFGSAERLDLPDLLSIDSYTAADFKYLIQTFIGGDTPYVLKGFDVIQPQDSIGTENISIRVADSIVYYPGSNAGSFYYGLPEGNTNSQPVVPELRKNSTNFIYLTFNTFDTAKDSRAFWDPDQNGGDGGEFSQDINTESVLSIEVNVSVSTFPDNTIPICKVTVGSSVIESIQDCRDMMFRLGKGGVSPDPFSNYTFRNDPSSIYARSEPSSSMTSALDPNPFQGGDKNIYTLKEWMDVVMTKLKELGGTTYWYEGASGGPSPTPSNNNIFLDALASTLKSKGEWQHSGTTPGQATWTQDIHYLSLRDPRDLILRASTINLSNDEVAWIEIERDLEINGSSQSVSWTNGSNVVNGATGAFINLAKGDWTKKKTDSSSLYLRVEEFYALPNLAGGTTTAALAQSIRLSANYAGITGSEIGEYTKGEYLLTDVNITDRDDATVQAAGGNFFWIAYRSDTILSLSGITPTQLTIDITEADGERARVTSTVAHGLVDGDRVTITTGPYAGTYQVDVADTDDFYIQTTVTGDSLTQTAFYAVVTTAARSTAYGYSLETAAHGYESNQKVTIQGTSSLYDSSYYINVRSSTSFQIPIGSLIPNPGAISGEIVVLPRMNVRTEFGTVKVVQGESIDIGDADSKNVLNYIGMESLAQMNPAYHLPASYNALRGHANYNSEVDDNLTVRAARLTAMMADRVQERGFAIIGRTNITSVTSGANQQISALGNLTLVKPSSPDQTITLTSAINLPANSAIVADLDRDGSAAIVPTVVSLGSQLLLQENRLILFYRFGTTTVYDWRGNILQPSGHINTGAPEDSQNRNVTVYNPGTVHLNTTSGLLTLDLDSAAEISDVTVLAAASVPQSSYFLFNSANNSPNYYVWYNKDAGGTDPLVVGRTGIQVNITTGQAASVVATATQTAINTIAGANVTASVSVDTVTITNDLVGLADDTVDGTTATTFTFVTQQQGFDPDIEILIPGSSNNTIDVDAINTLGTLVLADGQSVWVRINRFAAKTFNTISLTDTPDTDVAGALYISNTSAVPYDQDVIVLWTRVDNNLLVTHQASDPRANIYEEFLDVISGIPSNSYEIQGPVTANTILQLPLDSRASGQIQEYVVGSGQLELYLNGQFLRVGIDYDEVGTDGALSKRIEILQNLVVNDVLAFRIDAQGAVYFAASSGGGGGTLQDAYDGGRFITVITGQPIVISGASGKLLSVQGDMDVTGVIDPKGITFSQEASDPLDTNDYGLWRNTSDELIFKRGISTALNISTDLLRRDGTLAMTGALDMGTYAISNLASPSAGTDATNKTYTDAKAASEAAAAAAAALVTVSNDFLKLDGTNPMEAALDMATFKITNLGAPTLSTDAATKAYADAIQTYADTAFLKLDGTNPMAATLDMNSNLITNLASPIASTDAVNKAYVDSPDRYTALYANFTNNTGSTILAGSVVALSLSVAGEIILANASAISTSNSLIGVVVNNILTGQSGRVQIAGKATVLVTSPFTIGKRAYISTTSGYATSTPPSGIGQTVMVIGFADTTSTVYLQPHLDTVNENAYEEPLTVISGIPSNTYEIQGPVSASSTLTLPLDSRASSSVQQYIVGQGILEVYLNGQLLKSGIDYSEIGSSGSASSTITILQDLVIGDVVVFRINLTGSAFFSVGGGSGSLQNAYNNGNTITVVTGTPITINGPVSEKLLVINGDIDVTGIIDPKGITFTQQVSNPLPLNMAGIWADSAGEMQYQKGDMSPPVNVSQVISGNLSTGSVTATLINNTGSTLLKSTPVTVNSSGELAVVDVSTESNATAIIGIVSADISNTLSGSIVISGKLENVTTIASLGDTIYVSKTGGATNVKPSIGIGGFVAGDFIIRLGVITKNISNPSNKDIIINIQTIGQL